MSACQDWQDKLLDHALGLPASAGLESHLANCAVCCSALAEWRARAARLDAGVRQLQAAEPSPYLASRVLANIKSAPAEARWVGKWRVALLACAFVMAIGLLVRGVQRTREVRERGKTSSPLATRLSHWSSPTEALLRSPADPLFRTIPRLGESFFEMKRGTDEAKHEKGGRNAN